MRARTEQAKDPTTEPSWDPTIQVQEASKARQKERPGWLQAARLEVKLVDVQLDDALQMTSSPLTLDVAGLGSPQAMQPQLIIDTMEETKAATMLDSYD
jgi:hypothetical protein